MKPGLTAILYVLDRSGSMQDVWGEAVGAFDHFLAEQKAVPGEAEFGLTVFDDRIIHFPIAPLKDEAPLSERKAVYPRGMTALLDAVGEAVTRAGVEFSQRPEGERPERVLLVIHTDGYENASHAYKPEQVKEMIQHQKDHYNWEVLFLGADQDAWAAGSAFAASTSISFNNNKTSQGLVGQNVSVNTTSYRTTGNLADQGSVDVRNQ